MRERHSVGDEVLGKTRILAERCPTCIMRPADERIAVGNERVRELVRDAISAGSFVVCHSTLPGVAPAGVRPAVCRGFADAYDTRDLQLIRRLWGFVEVSPPRSELDRERERHNADQA